MAEQPEHLTSKLLKTPPEYKDKVLVHQSIWELWSRVYGEDWVKRNCVLHPPICHPAVS